MENTLLNSIAITIGSGVTGGVIGSIINGIVNIYSGNRKIQIENITQERAKWRDKIRELSIEVYKAAIEGKYQEIDKLQIEFAVRLNPYDDEDIGILKAIYELKDKQNQEKDLFKKLEEFSDCVALLLKHDWERAKYEAKPWYSHLCFFSCLKYLFEPQEKRILYTDLKKKYTCIASCNNCDKEIEKQKSSNYCCNYKLICLIFYVIGFIFFIALIGCGLIKVLRFICQL